MESEEAKVTPFYPSTDPVMTHGALGAQVEDSNLAEEGTFWCPRCRTSKHTDAFSPAKTKRGRKVYCKSCCSAYEATRYRANPESFRHAANARRKEAPERFRAKDRRTQQRRATDPAHRALHRQYSQDAERRRHGAAARVIVCLACSAVFCPLFGQASNLGSCSAECARALFEQNRRRKASAYKARKRDAAVERFDPFEVFERDRWLCQICGGPTPREKRGTWQPDAPELDHTMPLSKGGKHSRANTRCACRACNGRKAARII